MSKPASIPEYYYKNADGGNVTITRQGKCGQFFQIEYALIGYKGLTFKELFLYGFILNQARTIKGYKLTADGLAQVKFGRGLNTRQSISDTLDLLSSAGLIMKLSRKNDSGQFEHGFIIPPLPADVAGATNEEQERPAVVDEVIPMYEPSESEVAYHNQLAEEYTLTKKPTPKAEPARPIKTSKVAGGGYIDEEKLTSIFKTMNGLTSPKGVGFLVGMVKMYKQEAHQEPSEELLKRFAVLASGGNKQEQMDEVRRAIKQAID